MDSLAGADREAGGQVFGQMAAGAWDAQLPVGGQVLIWRKKCSAQRSTWSVSFLPGQLDQPVGVLSLSL